MLSVKQARIKYHFFFSFLYDSTWDWTLVSRNIGEHSTQIQKGIFQGKVIYRQLYKKLKLYEHKPESVPENETRKTLCDFVIQTDHIIPARRPDLVLIYKLNQI